MKKSTNFSAEKGRRLKIFATIFAAIFALIALATGLALKNYGGGRTDLTQTTAAATAPTDTSKYWTDEAAWSAAGKDFNNYTLSGSGGPDDPYLIQNEWDLAYLSWTIYTKNPIPTSHVSSLYYYSGIYFKQTADLNLSAYYWQPIGIYYLRDGTSVTRYFSGYYDGGSHTVSGVFTPAGESNGYSYQGLFGRVIGQSSTSKATISNVGVIDSFVQGDSYVGGVIGDASKSTVTNCYNTGSVEGSDYYVGGVVGWAFSSSTVTNCYNTGSVSGSGSRVGGVVGYADSGDVLNCYNTGSVEGSGDYVGGVIGDAEGDTVENCYNTGSVSGSGSVGGVAGLTSDNVIIKNCYNTGLVSGSSQVGGVVGRTNGSTVTNCYNTGSVEGSDDHVGGVVGYDCGIVENCYNTGSVSGGEVVGGVVGRTNASTVTNCYNTGSVEGSRYDVGGVVGWAHNSSTVTNCYNIGSVSGSGYAVGGVVGNDSTISNTYYGGNCTLSKGIGSGSGSAVKIDKPVEEWAKNKEWYSADAVNSDGSSVWSADSPWDFETVWKFNKEIPEYITGGYPLLKNVDMRLPSDIIYWTDEAAWSAAGKDFNNYTLSGSGGQDDPYLIQSEWDLAYLSWTVYTNNPIEASHVSSSLYYYSGIYFEQTADLDLSAYYWQPIGIRYLRDGASVSRYFSGCYDGGSHTVSGVFTPAGKGDGYSYQGLFGRVYGLSSTSKATISNVGVIDSFVQGYNNVGGVVGYAYSNSTIKNCYNTGLVEGSKNNVGGVVGKAENATITNCYNTGSVSGSDEVGGVVGGAYYGTVENCYNTGSVGSGYYVGGVVGRASGGHLTNCYNTGSVSGSGSQVGGVVGRYDYAGTVENCYNTGSVSGPSYVGGVAGLAMDNVRMKNCYNTGSISSSGFDVGGVGGSLDGTVENCYNTGSVSGEDMVGGVGGSLDGKVTNCYNIGSVSGEKNVGGVVGSLDGTVTNCYNTGSVSGSGNIGGVVGFANSSSTISNTYYGGACTLSKGIGYGSGSAVKIDEPAEEWAKDQDWYSANAVNSDGSLVWSADSPWDFETVWEFVENAPDCATNNGYPVLQGVFSSQVIYWTDVAVWSAAGKDFNNYTLSGSGSQEDPYLIQSEWDLAYLSWTIYTNHPIEASHVSSNYYYYSGIYFEQTADLDLSAYYWQPIGIVFLRDGTSVNRYFSGCYDGGGYTVSGLFTPAGSNNDYSHQGLFGYVCGRSSTNLATISNVGVIDSFVQGYNYVGGVVGWPSSNSTITNCYNTGSVIGSGGSVGGVVGSAYYGTVENCYNTGSISGSSRVGGVVGYAYSSTVTNCYNTASVSGPSRVGGVVGYVSSGSSTITNCYNTGSVSGSDEVGGVVGFGTATNCYNTGSVSGSSSVGGIVGTASESSAVTNCGFEGVINGSSSVGAIVGDIYVAPATISNCYAVAESDSEISLIGSNSGNGTIENIVGIITSGGTSKKVYTGSDFSGFAWLNFDSSPVPKGLSWAGQFQEPPAEYAGNSNWILTKMQSEGWSAI